MKWAPFNLSRWFATVGLLSIAAISLTSAWLLSEFLTARMVQQEARLTQETFDSLVRVEKAEEFFANGHATAPAKEMRGFFEHVMQFPDVLRVNLYSRQGRVIWSSDPTLIGRQFADNADLEQALGGKLVAHGGSKAKPEHTFLTQRYFVEIYSPVRGDARGSVVGVAEMYKAPRALSEAISAGQRAVWIGAALAGLFMYAALFWMVRRAENLIREQRELLVQSETLAAIGEMSSAVAHGIRNPLASIRSSAELALESRPGTWRQAGDDIIEQVDRLESWVRELLAYSQPLAGRPEPVALGALVKSSLQGFERELERRGIRASADVPDDLPPVQADALLLGQVFNTLIANSVEALETGGRIAVSVGRQGERRLRVRIRDSGPGMTREQLANAFKPFHTTKANGIGVGLALARRIVQRFGGSIALASERGRGTVVDILLPAT